MKKIHILFATLLAAAGLVSCDMEKYPYNAVEESQYMKSIGDFEQAHTGLYSNYRTITTGGYVLLPDIQCDDFQAVSGFSNTYGNQYRWDFQTTDGNIETIWSAYYSTIARCNFYLNNYDKVVAGEVLPDISEADMTQIGTWAADAYFTRAYCYYMLSTYFCQAYEPATAESTLGLPVQLVYSPTSDSSTYPGRSSLKATYDQILSDLDNASQLWQSQTYDKYYISIFSIMALQARVALNMKDYPTAISMSTTLINNSASYFPLATDAASFRAIWNEDSNQESIWQIYMQSPSELGAATGSTFWGNYLPNTPELQQMDYIPSQSLVDLYADGENDIRFQAFLAPYHLTTGTGSSGDVYIFDKYPGNAVSLGNLSVDDHYCNMSKPFRIAEQYLIAAEAFMESNDTENAAAYLNALRSARIIGYTAQTFNNPETLRTAIRDERHKELVGEGFRLNDLKRWGQGFDRTGTEQDANLTQNGLTYTGLVISADNFRFTWPIPKTEMDVNPQLAGQQNPGY